MSTITVTIIETARPPWRPRRRHQPWRWVAKTANGRIVATSGESYTNRADALAAAETVFGWATLEEIRRLHAPMRAVCDECYGDGCQDCGGAGGWQVCQHCCIDGDQAVFDVCVESHEHSADGPACSTAEIIARAGL